MFSTMFNHAIDIKFHENFANLSQYLLAQGPQTSMYLGVGIERNTFFCSLQSARFSHYLDIWRDNSFVERIGTLTELEAFTRTDFPLDKPVSHMHVYNFGDFVLNYVKIHFANEVVLPFSLQVSTIPSYKTEVPTPTNWQQEGF